jgi:glutathione S-transferase
MIKHTTPTKNTSFRDLYNKMSSASSPIELLTSPGDGKLFLCSGISAMFSPFVVKVSAILNYHRIPYEFKLVSFNGLPRGKMPIIHHDGKLISDSHAIVQYLIEKGLVPKGNINAEVNAQAEILRLALENFFYWGVLLERCVDNWSLTRAMYFEKIMPPEVFATVDQVIQPMFLKKLDQVGISRYPREEFLQNYQDFIRKTSVLLGQKKLFFGENDEPSVQDLALYGFFQCAIHCAPLNPIAVSTIEKYPNLQNFVKHMEALIEERKSKA